MPHPLRTQTVSDGGWHLLGLTTHPEGGKGFQLFVDGALAAEADAGVVYRGTHWRACPATPLTLCVGWLAVHQPAARGQHCTRLPCRSRAADADGFQKAATGGGPLNLTGDLTLCARSDLEPKVGRGAARPAVQRGCTARPCAHPTRPCPFRLAARRRRTHLLAPQRFLTGSVAHLLVYNSSLTADQMRLLYEGSAQLAGGSGAATAPGPAPAAATPAPAPVATPPAPAPTAQQAAVAAAVPSSPAADPPQGAESATQGAAQLAGQPLCSQTPIPGGQALPAQG